MGQPGKIDEMPLEPQLVIELFDRCELNFVGPISPSSYCKVYILTCTDYVMIWTYNHLEKILCPGPMLE